MPWNSLIRERLESSTGIVPENELFVNTMRSTQQIRKDKPSYCNKRIDSHFWLTQKSLHGPKLGWQRAIHTRVREIERFFRNESTDVRSFCYIIQTTNSINNLRSELASDSSLGIVPVSPWLCERSSSPVGRWEHSKIRHRAVFRIATSAYLRINGICRSSEGRVPSRPFDDKSRPVTRSRNVQEMPNQSQTLSVYIQPSFRPQCGPSRFR
jgi:hypothetical protein